MFWPTCSAWALLVASAVAAPTSSVLHEKRREPILGRRERVQPDAIIPIRIALTQNNLHTGYDRLMEVSHPTSERYGQYLSADEVHDIFAPSEESVTTVKDWLRSSGLVQEEDILTYRNKGWLTVYLPAQHAESLLSTQYYEHELSDGSRRLGCDEYHLPAHVAPHVDLIKPAVVLSGPVSKREVERRWTPQHRGGHGGWPGPVPAKPHWPHWQPPPGAGSLPPDLRSCGVNITPTCIQALYGIPRATLHDPSNVMGLYETGDAFSSQDINLDFKHFAPWVPQPTNPKVISVDGGMSPVAPGSDENGGESDIDLQLSISLIYPQTVTVYQVDDLPNSSGETGKSGFLNTFLDSVDGSYCNYTAYGITGDSPSIDAVYPDNLPGGYKGKLECGTYNLTRVLSISYGAAEIDYPKAYVERQCNEFMKLGLQGHSIFVAAGDYGVASFPGSDNNEFGCLSGNGQNGTIYNPDYPSGCPYITVVGATRLYPNDTVLNRESAMQVNLTAFNIATGAGPTAPPYDFFATGGGFSNYFAPPAYQSKQVANYLASHAPPVKSYVANADASNIGENGGVYNRAGRAYPDVSANGAFLLSYVNLTQVSFFGTSLASPIFASVITLINEERTAIGKGPVGFVNPVLYEHPWVLNDITNGSNPNCGSTGFFAAPGWDPVTGLGTPSYPKMLGLFTSLP